MAKLILRPTYSSYIGGAQTPYYPTETSEDKLFTLINEEVADDDSTYIQASSINNTDCEIGFNLPDELRKILKPYSIKLVVRASVDNSNCTLSWELLNPDYLLNLVIEDTYELGAFSAVDTYENFSMDISNEQVSDIWARLLNDVLFINFALKYTSSDGKNTAIPRANITQVYFEVEYEDYSNVFVHAKNSGIWTENSVSGIYYKVNGTWKPTNLSEVSINNYNMRTLRDSTLTAVLYNDGDFVFQQGQSAQNGKILDSKYKDFINANNQVGKGVPWRYALDKIKRVEFNVETSPVSIANWFVAADSLTNINYANFVWDNVVNMQYSHYLCSNLTGSPVCGENVVNMSYAYGECSNLTGSPVCGENVVNMQWSYGYCSNLTGSPMCGENVVDMSSAYRRCSNLTGSPVCGSKVVDMGYAYSECSNLTGSPACGNKVETMVETYANCSNLTGLPVCGENVVDMSYAYRGCSNLTGSPMCGNKVETMVETYANCSKLNGAAICGVSVTNMWNTYKNCQNIGRNAYFYSSNVNMVNGCFANKSNSRRLNIFVPENSTTYNSCLDNSTSSLVSAKITWTTTTSYSYNAAYNIYIYPVSDVAAKRKSNGE